MALSNKIVYYKSEEAVRVVELSTKEKIGFNTDNQKLIDLTISHIETMDAETREEELALLEDNYYAKQKETTLDSVSLEETSKLTSEVTEEEETQEPEVIVNSMLEEPVEVVTNLAEEPEEVITHEVEETVVEQVQEQMEEETVTEAVKEVEIQPLTDKEVDVEKVSVDVDKQTLDKKVKIFSKEINPTTFEVMKLVEAPAFDEALTVKIEDIVLPEIFQNFKAVTRVSDEHLDETKGLLHILRKESVAELLNTMQDSSYKEKLNIIFNILCEMPENSATSTFAINNLMQTMFLGINAEPVPFCTAVTNLVSREGEN